MNCSGTHGGGVNFYDTCLPGSCWRFVNCSATVDAAGLRFDSCTAPPTVTDLTFLGSEGNFDATGMATLVHSYSDNPMFSPEITLNESASQPNDCFPSSSPAGSRTAGASGSRPLVTSSAPAISPSSSVASPGSPTASATAPGASSLTPTSSGLGSPSSDSNGSTQSEASTPSTGSLGLATGTVSVFSGLTSLTWSGTVTVPGAAQFSGTLQLTIATEVLPC